MGTKIKLRYYCCSIEERQAKRGVDGSVFALRYISDAGISYALGIRVWTVGGKLQIYHNAVGTYSYFGLLKTQIRSDDEIQRQRVSIRPSCHSVSVKKLCVLSIYLGTDVTHSRVCRPSTSFPSYWTQFFQFTSIFWSYHSGSLELGVTWRLQMDIGIRQVQATSHPIG